MKYHEGQLIKILDDDGIAEHFKNQTAKILECTNNNKYFNIYIKLLTCAETYYLHHHIFTCIDHIRPLTQDEELLLLLSQKDHS